MKHRFTLILLMLTLGCLLRIWTIGKSSLWFDEAFTRDVTHYADPGALLQGKTLGDTLPPLHFFLLNLWMRVSGESELSLRFLSAFFTMLTLPLCYQLGRLLFGPRGAVMALLFATLSPLQISYGQEVRFYAQSIFFGAVLALGLVMMIQRKRYGVLVYLLGATGGLYTHYFVGVMIAAAHIWLLLYRPARERWRSWLAADIIVGILFLPQLSLFLQKSNVVLGSFWIAKPNIAQPFTTTPLFLLYGATLTGLLIPVGIVLLVTTVVIGGLDLFRFAPRRVRAYWIFGLLTVLLTLLTVFAVSLFKSSIYLDRSFGILSTLLIVTLAGGYAYARRLSPVPILTVGLIVLMAIGDLHYALTPNDTKPPYRQIAAELLTQPDALTTPIVYLHDAPSLSMDYYAPQLSSISVVVDMGTHSWMYPQDILFPQTWKIFGIQIVPRQRIEEEYFKGTFRVVIAATVAPEDFQIELDTLKRLQTACQTLDHHDYPPATSIWKFHCDTVL